MGYFSSSIINNFLILLTGIHTFSLEFSPLRKWHLYENFEILKKTLLVMCTVWSHKWPPIKLPSLRSEEDQIDDFGFYTFHSQRMTWKRIYVVLTFELVVESNNEKNYLSRTLIWYYLLLCIICELNFDVYFLDCDFGKSWEWKVSIVKAISNENKMFYRICYTLW